MWTNTVGLRNGQNKYLTAETFGHKINANGLTLKRKQQWTIEALATDSDLIALKSHLNCYLAVDSFGNVTCDNNELTDQSRFIITICSINSNNDASGEEQISWAFRNVSRNYYIGCTSDGMLQCNAKMPQSRAELWHVHLLPARGATMFALKSIGRKRFARFNPTESTISVDSTCAWGSDTLFQFQYVESGKYSLLTADSLKLLTCDGMCIDSSARHNNTCLFTIEYHNGFVAFRDSQGRYLAAAGRSSLLRTRSTTVSRDELFSFEAAPIQLSLRASFNNRWMSIKQGVDVSANQSEITDHETFQFEYSGGAWHVQTHAGTYLSFGANSTIQARAESPGSRFQLKWFEDGTCALHDDTKWICARKSGQLYTATSDDSCVRFFLKFRNRTVLNLRAPNTGFVGLNVRSGRLESNRTFPDSVRVEYANSDSFDGAADVFNCCYLRMAQNHKYWTISDGQIAADAASAACAQQWHLELRTGHAIAIRTFESHAYLQLTQNGSVIVQNCGPEHATLWEF